MGGNSHGCKHCPYRKKSEFIGKREVKEVKCDKCKRMVEAHPGYPEGLPTVINQRTKESWKVCDECYKCELCKKNSHNLITNEQSEKWEAGMWLCSDCCDNKEGNKKLTWREYRTALNREDETKTQEDTCDSCFANKEQERERQITTTWQVWQETHWQR